MTNLPTETVTLPTWAECRDAYDRGDATALQLFIYHHEPADVPIANSATEAKFREQLAALILEVRS